jgi:hypothetical protein
MIPEGDPRHKKFEYYCSRNRLEKMIRSDRVLYVKETLTLMSAHMSVSIDRSRSSRAWAIIPLPLMESASENRSRSWAWAWVVHPYSEINGDSLLVIWLERMIGLYLLIFLAVCSPQCSNGGTCSAPNSCTVSLELDDSLTGICELYVCLVYVIVDWISVWNTYVYAHCCSVTLLYTSKNSYNIKFSSVKSAVQLSIPLPFYEWTKGVTFGLFFIS